MLAPPKKVGIPLSGRFCDALTGRSHGTAAGLSALRRAVREIYPAQKSNAWIALKTGRKSDGEAEGDFAAQCEPSSDGFSTFAHNGPHGGQRGVLRHRRGTDCHPIRGRATRCLTTRNTGRPVFDEEYGCSECGLMIHGLAETEAVAWWVWHPCRLCSFLRRVSSSR